MWSWKCSACGEEFLHAKEAEAERMFLEHARAAHNPKTLLSFKADS